MEKEQQQKDHDLLIEIHTIVKQTHEQACKTNGRVTKLEAWRNYIGGGIALFCIFGLPMLWMLLNDVKASGDMIKVHVAEKK